MSTPSYYIRCTRKRIVAPGVYELAFTRPEGFTFKPGQFVLFDVPLMEKPEDVQTRALSIASLNSENELLFVVKLKPGGRVSRWIDERLQARDASRDTRDASRGEKGTEARMQGPFGLFTLRDTPRDIVFIATGAGIAPFRSQALTAFQKEEKRSMHLFFGVRSEEHLFWHQEFEKLDEAHGNFHFSLCLSSPSEQWKGNRGRVQTFLPSLLREPEKFEVYICGAPEMVADVKKFVLDELKVPKGQVHAEGYI